MTLSSTTPHTGPGTGPDLDARRAMYGVYAVFIAGGLVFAAWAARIPQVRDRLHLTPSELGVLLLSLSLGAVIGLPLAGSTVHRLGTRRTITAMALLTATGMATVAIGYRHGPGPVAVGLFAMGLGFGTWDVAMNVEGAAVERGLERSIMSRFHAGFSVGTVIGALISAALIAVHVSVTVSLLGFAVVIAVMVPLAARRFLPAGDTTPTATGEKRHHPLKAWTERRTLLIGVVVLSAAFSEGTGNDWLGVAMIDGYGASAAIGALSFALFMAGMTVGRWFGSHALDRWGRVPVLRASGVLALVGLMVVVFGRALPFALIGVVAWGLGTALGFPVGMSAAADDQRRAAARISVVASIGYTAFLSGPPLIGLLGDHVGVLHSISVASGLLAIGLLVAGSCRPIPLDE
jgi:predicted MFS family arabinose efflux permease